MLHIYVTLIYSRTTVIRSGITFRKTNAFVIKQVGTIQRYEKMLNQHNHTWRSIFAHMQDCGLDIVTRDDLEVRSI